MAQSDEPAGAVALVTGAAGGVGRATVDLLRARGARVVAEDIDAAVHHLAGDAVAAVQGDVAQPATVREAVSAATYCATKGAIVQLTRQRAIEHAPRVRVNALAPGAIDTGFMDEVLAGVPDREARLRAVAESHPLKRLARPEEIAEVIGFLASPRSSIITGAIVMADGGFTASSKR